MVVLLVAEDVLRLTTALVLELVPTAGVELATVVLRVALNAEVIAFAVVLRVGVVTAAVVLATEFVADPADVAVEDATAPLDDTVPVFAKVMTHEVAAPVLSVPQTMGWKAGGGHFRLVSAPR